MSRTVVHLLRHGEVHNPGRILYGRLPGFRLSEDGQQMACDAAEALRGRDVAEVVASPLLRAQQTAAPIAAVFDVGITTDVRDRVTGHEAVCVSHQLPIWTVRRHVEGRRLWHRPDRRQCGLASLTSLVFDGTELVRVDYSEPAAEAGRRRAPGV